MKKYILEGKEPVEATNLLAWADWFETADTIVKRTTLGRKVLEPYALPPVTVSTVFLGLDRRFVGGGPPLLFETMVFGGERDGAQWRYSTWDEAVAGHDAAVNGLDKRSLSRLFRWLRRSWSTLRERFNAT